MLRSGNTNRGNKGDTSDNYTERLKEIDRIRAIVERVNNDDLLNVIIDLHCKINEIINFINTKPTKEEK